MSLTDALKTLAEAHGSKALASAFARLQGQIRSARRASRQQYGALAQTFAAAMTIWDAQKADGVSREDRLSGLEKSLRASWPTGREWKYLCDRCRDYGLETQECHGDATCGRVKPHLPHEFGTPCWCQAGQKFKAKPKPSAEDFTAAGKSQPMTKVGR